MGIAFHKKTDKKYIQYTVRIESNILDKVKEISQNEDISINAVINQSLNFAIEDYEKTNSKKENK